MHTDKENTAKLKNRNSLTLLLILFTIFTSLLIFNVITEASWNTTILTSFFLTTIFYFSDKVSILDFKNLKITLSEIHKAESSVKALALLTLDTIEADRVTSFHTVDPLKEDPYVEVSEKLRKLATS